MATGKARTRRGACDVVCLSHLRWDFVWQRPQHLMSRCARERRVFFVEESVPGAKRAEMVVTPRDDSLLVCVPHLPDEADATTESRRLLEQLVRDYPTHPRRVVCMEPAAISRREWTPHLAGHSCSPASCNCDSVGSGDSLARADEEEFLQIRVTEHRAGATLGRKFARWTLAIGTAMVRAAFWAGRSLRSREAGDHRRA